MDVKPSTSELTVLKLLWRRSPLSAREVHDGIAERLPWSFSSTRKTLERMEEKGLVRVRDVHGMRVHEPTVTKVATLGRLMRDFASQVLDLEDPLPVTAFAKSPLLEPGDVAELERLLQESDGEDPQ